MPRSHRDAAPGTLQLRGVPPKSSGERPAPAPRLFVFVHKREMFLQDHNCSESHSHHPAPSIPLPVRGCSPTCFFLTCPGANSCWPDAESLWSTCPRPCACLGTEGPTGINVAGANPPTSLGLAQLINSCAKPRLVWGSQRLGAIGVSQQLAWSQYHPEDCPHVLWAGVPLLGRSCCGATLRLFGIDVYRVVIPRKVTQPGSRSLALHPHCAGLRIKFTPCLL